VSSCDVTARFVMTPLTELANVRRCANGAASASLVRALGKIQSQVPPELSPHGLPEIFGSLSGASSAVCSLDALKTMGVPDELLGRWRVPRSILLALAVLSVAVAGFVMLMLF